MVFSLYLCTLFKKWGKFFEVLIDDRLMKKISFFIKNLVITKNVSNFAIPFEEIMGMPM